MINFNLLDALMIGLFFLVIIIRLIRGLTAYNLKKDILSIQNSCVFIMSLIITLSLSKKIISPNINNIISFINGVMPEKFTTTLSSVPSLTISFITLIILLIIIEVFTLILRGLNNLLFFRGADKFESNMFSVNKWLKGILSAIISIPRAGLNIFIIVFILMIVTMVKADDIKFTNYVNNSFIYNLVKKECIEPLIPGNVLEEISEDAGKVLKSSKPGLVTTLYNGTELDVALKSNDNFKVLAKELRSGTKSDREAVHNIYKWMENNLTYDHNKANSIAIGDYSPDSGAIPMFNSKKGICFDYACFMTVLSREMGYKVQILTGQGYTGEVWENHAWNRVYLKDEEKWINVDTTFASSNNYFDNVDFNKDHKGGKVIGEW